MDWLEQELREALGRKEPAPGFGERVKRKAKGPRVERPAPKRGSAGLWTSRPVSLWLAAAAGILVIAGAGGLGYRQHQGEMARQEVMRAFRIAGAELNHIQTQVREARR